MLEYFLQPQDISKLLACEPAQSLQLCLIETPWTVDHQAPLSMGFSRQEYWSGLPFPGIEPASLMSPALAKGFFTTELPGKPKNNGPNS